MNHTLLKPLKFSVFGLGNSLYADNFNVIAKNVDSFLSQLSAERFVPLALGDENVLESKHGTIEQDFQVNNYFLYFKIRLFKNKNTYFLHYFKTEYVVTNFRLGKRVC